jgi:transcriptional regulator with XRE-family HTH domain
MPMRKIELGGFGEDVARNVRRVREAAGMTYAELSRRLDTWNRPIPVLGLRHIESGQRRVDVDDLVALGVALNVAPITLLLPEQDAHNTFLLLVGGMKGVTDMFKTERNADDGNDQ